MKQLISFLVIGLFIVLSSCGDPNECCVPPPTEPVSFPSFRILEAGTNADLLNPENAISYDTARITFQTEANGFMRLFSIRFPKNASGQYELQIPITGRIDQERALEQLIRDYYLVLDEQDTDTITFDFSYGNTLPVVSLNGTPTALLNGALRIYK